MSLYKSCGHRPAALDDASSLTETIMQRLLTKPTAPGVIARSQIVQATYELLKRFDPAAASHYLAYHPLLEQPE